MLSFYESGYNSPISTPCFRMNFLLILKECTFMKKCFLFVSFLIVSSCNQQDRTETLLEKALAASEFVIHEKEPEAVKGIDENGSVIYTGKRRTYIISKENIKCGFLNDDSLPDIIVSVDVFSGQFQVISEHLVFLTQGDSLELSCSIESDMKILYIKDNTITADVPMHSRNSPLFNCASCREVLNYHLRNGSLVRVE